MFVNSLILSIEQKNLTPALARIFARPDRGWLYTKRHVLFAYVCSFFGRWQLVDASFWPVASFYVSRSDASWLLCKCRFLFAYRDRAVSICEFPWPPRGRGRSAEWGEAEGTTRRFLYGYWRILVVAGLIDHMARLYFKEIQMYNQQWLLTFMQWQLVKTKIVGSMAVIWGGSNN